MLRFELTLFRKSKEQPDAELTTIPVLVHEDALDIPSESPGKPPAPPIVTFPEGGFQAWSTLAGAWLVQFCCFGYANAYGVYQDYYVREYLNHYSSSQISWIGSTQLLFLLSTGVLTGRAFDRGYFYHLTISGTLLLSFCLFMLSLSQPQQYYQVFLTQGLGVGLALGLSFTPSMGIISHYFQRRRALALGIVTSGSSLGGVLHPIMLNHLFYGKTGFHKGVRASAALNLGLLAVANVLMRTRLPPARRGGSLGKTVGVFARDGAYVFAVTGTFLVFMGVFFPIFYIQLDAAKHNLSPTFSFYTLAILNGASVIGRVVPSVLAHYVGVFNLIIPSALACGVLILCMVALHNVVGTVMLAALFGFFSGGFVSLLSPMLASLAKDHTEIGARMGLCFFFCGIAGFIGTPIAGALLTDRFIWWRPIVFSGVCTIAGFVLLFVCRQLVVMRKGTQMV